ncbi:uncharacterized protein LOC122266285 isoform X2 [Penaeus japonicus]|uniref:uncharacterized protein LOC122266285 isoform X2 n=1 Tax=Penaeus japonicus TaxID=27405 RepID=UPI001C70BF49|nr:uncharacterized protein LOC122266285 isoform X2 [Penaeus japonicus]
MKRVAATASKSSLNSSSGKGTKLNLKKNRQERAKKTLSHLEATLDRLGSKVKGRSCQQVIEETISLTRDLEDQASMLLADIRAERGSTISNASKFTLSSMKAMFSRRLWEAANKAKRKRRTDDSINDFVEKYMEDSTKKFFSGLVGESSADGTAAPAAQEEDWCPEKALLASPSPSTTRGPAEGAAALATPRTSCYSREGLVTPRQTDEEQRQCMVTPGLARHKRQRSVSTPVSTPASVDSQNSGVASTEAKKPRSFVCKKSLTFASDSCQSRKDEAIDGETPEIDVLSSPGAAAARRTLDEPSTTSADRGSSLPPAKRLRLGPDFDPEVIQELLPLPTHCSAQLSMTPLSALKNPSASPGEAPSKPWYQMPSMVSINVTPRSPRHEAPPQNPKSFQEEVDGKIGRMAVELSSSDSLGHGPRVACIGSSPSMQENDRNIHTRGRGRGKEEPNANQTAKGNERTLARESLRAGSRDSHMHVPKSGTGSIDSKQQYSFLIDHLGPFSCVRETSSSFRGSYDRPQNDDKNQVSRDSRHNVGSIVVSSISFKDEVSDMPCSEEPPFQVNEKANLWSCKLSRNQDMQTETLGNILSPVAGSSKSQAFTPKGKLLREFSHEPRSPDCQAATPKGKLAEALSHAPYPPGCLGCTPKGRLASPVLPGPSGCRAATPKGKPVQILCSVPGSSYQDTTPKRPSVQVSSPEPGLSGNRLVREDPDERLARKMSSLCRPDSKAVTPDAHFVMLHIQAPRKLSVHATRRRTPACKRSLAREFAEMNAGNPFITPPRSPMRPDYYLPEMESEDDE